MNTNAQDITVEEVEQTEDTETTLTIQTGVKAGGWFDDFLRASTATSASGIFF